VLCASGSKPRRFALNASTLRRDRRLKKTGTTSTDVNMDDSKARRAMLDLLLRLRAPN